MTLAAAAIREGSVVVVVVVVEKEGKAGPRPTFVDGEPGFSSPGPGLPASWKLP